MWGPPSAAGFRFNLNSAVETANHAKYANPKRLLERPHFTRWVKGLGGTNSISTLSFRVVRVVRGSSQLWFSGLKQFSAPHSLTHYFPHLISDLE